MKTNLNISDYYNIVKEKSMQLEDIKKSSIWQGFLTTLFNCISAFCKTGEIYKLIYSSCDNSREPRDRIMEIYLGLFDTISRGPNAGILRLDNILSVSRDSSSFTSMLYGYTLWCCKDNLKTLHDAGLSFDQPIDDDSTTTLGDTIASRRNSQEEFEIRETVLLMLREVLSSKITVSDAAYLYSLVPGRARMKALANLLISPGASPIEIVNDSLRAVALEYGFIELLDYIGSLEVDIDSFTQCHSYSASHLAQHITQLCYRKRQQLRSERHTYSL